jgi:hypothetical protein
MGMYRPLSSGWLSEAGAPTPHQRRRRGIAFVNDSAVTSAIIGPRTMEQLDSELPAAEVTLAASRSADRLQARCSAVNAVLARVPRASTPA